MRLGGTERVPQPPIGTSSNETYVYISPASQDRPRGEYGTEGQRFESSRGALWKCLAAAGLFAIRITVSGRSSSGSVLGAFSQPRAARARRSSQHGCGSRCYGALSGTTRGDYSREVCGPTTRGHGYERARRTSASGTSTISGSRRRGRAPSLRPRAAGRTYAPHPAPLSARTAGTGRLRREVLP
jgi:hypothetical protein